MNVLVVDDDRYRHDAFDEAMKGVKLAAFHVYNAVSATGLLDLTHFDLVLLDHDLGSLEDGAFVAKHIVNMPESNRPKRVIVQSWNRPGADRIVSILESAGIPVEWLPFGPACLTTVEAAVAPRSVDR